MWHRRLISITSQSKLCTRSKTTRPEEWRDPERYKTLVDPKQREEPVDYYTPEKWMTVKFHTLDHRERRIHSIATDDRIRSDPAEAQAISMEKFASFQNSLSKRGAVREAERYEPPENVEDTVISIASRVFSGQVSADKQLKEITFDDQLLKFKFLQLCAAEFNHEVANAELHEMKCVNDVVNFYLQPVEGSLPYDRLLKSQEKGQMPPNLMMLGDPEPFDPESTFLKGIDALPGIYFQPEGLRARRKYPVLKKKVFWPDL